MIARILSILQPFRPRQEPTANPHTDPVWLETRNRWRKESARHGSVSASWRAFSDRTHAMLQAGERR